MQIHSNEPEMTKGNDKSNDPNQDKKVDNLGKKSTIATDQRVTSVFYMVASLAAGGLLGVLGCTLYQQQIDVQEKSTSTGKDFIGFDAVLQEDIEKASAGRRIVFNNVLQNVGNAFKEGVFTCPIPGMYYFSWTTLANPGISSDTLLMLNGVAKRINYARDHTTKQYYSGTAAILLHLNRGDQVWIQMMYSGSNAYRGHSFFTGMLLKGD